MTPSFCLFLFDSKYLINSSHMDRGFIIHEPMKLGLEFCFGKVTFSKKNLSSYGQPIL